MAEEETTGPAPWPVTLQPWSNGKRFTVYGLEARYSARFGFDIDPPYEFTSDLTSSPSVLRSVVSIWGKHGLAALYHDYLYRHVLPGITRKMADQIMLEFMEVDGVGWTRRRLIYAAVRVGGKGSWQE